jgi:hypothetical protein
MLLKGLAAEMLVREVDRIQAAAVPVGTPPRRYRHRHRRQ